MSDIEEINQLIWSMGIKFRAELIQRPNPLPDWFPINQTFTLAATHIFLTLPDAIRRTLKQTTPEEIARRGKRLGSSVSPLAIWTLGYHFLVGREMLIDLSQLKANAQAEDIALVLDFWRRLTFTHRSDGRLDNSEAGAANVFLPATIVQHFYDALIPVDAGIKRRVEQFLSAVQEYRSVLNAEARLGIADSGPYPLNVERVLIIRDFFDLKGTYYPWRDVVAEVPHHTCALAFTFDPEDFQTLELSDQSELQTTPSGYREAIREIAFASSDSGSPQLLPFTEMDWLTRAIRKAQPKLEEWFNRRTRRERIITGALPWIIRLFAILPGDEVHRACDLSATALRLLPIYEDNDIQAARWLTHRCLVPGNLSAFAPVA